MKEDKLGGNSESQKEEMDFTLMGRGIDPIRLVRLFDRHGIQIRLIDAPDLDAGTANRALRGPHQTVDSVRVHVFSTADAVKKAFESDPEFRKFAKNFSNESTEEKNITPAEKTPEPAEAIPNFEITISLKGKIDLQRLLNLLETRKIKILRILVDDRVMKVLVHETATSTYSSKSVQIRVHSNYDVVKSALESDPEFRKYAKTFMSQTH